MLATLFLGARLLLPQTLPDPGAIDLRHRVRKGESRGDIEQRYGVRLGRELGAPGSIVELRATKRPVPQQLRRHPIRRGDSWARLATRYHVSEQDLRQWNPKWASRRRLPRYGIVRLWLNSGVAHYPLPAFELPLPDAPTPVSGTSIGRPQTGRLLQGTALPASPNYHIRFEKASFGSALAVRGLQRAIEAFRTETGFAAGIYIGAMSEAKGGKLGTHLSHRSGRDVDIRMPAMAHKRGHKLSTHEVDWHATFALLDAFVRTGQVQVIFVEEQHHRRLRRAALALGASDQRIAHVMAKVSHAPGHSAHIHVRFSCASDNAKCRG